MPTYPENKENGVGQDKTIKVLVIIPAYNEERNISQIIFKIREYAPNVDILVVDDGSTDNTSRLAKSEGVRVFILPFNLGYGSALQTGFLYAQKENYQFVVQLDGDGQHDPKYIDDLLREAQNGSADVVIGSRFLQNMGYKTPLIRRIGMILFGKIASLILRQKITDSTSGFQVMNQKVIQFYAGDFYPSDFPDANILILLHTAGFKIKEIPVSMYPPTSKNKSMHSGIIPPIYYIFKMFLSILTTLVTVQISGSDKIRDLYQR